MKRNKKYFINTKTQWGILIPLVTILLLLLYIQSKNKSDDIDECPRYTIGYSTGVLNKKVNYQYSTMGRDFTDSWRINPRSIKDIFLLHKENFSGRRFLIRVNCKKPEINEIDWTHSIPAWVTRAPEEGWSVLPTEFEQTEFEN